MYDTIIIGGGISGLYSAYKLMKKTPTIKILILEQNRKGYLGGRTGNAQFCGTSVVTGAGIGRKKKDKLLIKLLKELGISFGEFDTKSTYSPTLETTQKCDVKGTFLHLKSQYNEAKHSHLTFKRFATSLLTKEQYHHFIMCAGYTDFENEAAYDTLYDYGFEDNYSKWTGLSISWSNLVDELAKKIGLKNIKMSQNVLEIRENTDKSLPPFFLVKTKTDQFETKQVVIATTIHSVKTLLKPLITQKQRKIYEQIHGQPFLRVYGKFSKDSIPLLKMAVPHLIVVPGPLHKIITMDAEKGIYMIAYTDNLPAEMLHEHTKNNQTNRDLFARLVEKSLGLPQTVLELEEIAEWYWGTGTHYYEPLKGYETRKQFIADAQQPYPNILVVGEVISQNQGWVEGALESVDAVL